MSKKLFKKFSWFKNRSKILFLSVPIVLLLIPLLFFYKTLFFQLIPFPGDLLVANSEPYKSIPGMGAVPHKGQGADVVRELYPWKYFSIDTLKSGVFPLWNPYNFSGSPHFANLQSGTLYPVNIIFFVLPFISAWSIYIILQFVLLILFTYLFLREINLSKIPSILGALSFTFSGFIVVWGWYGNFGHTLAFLPLVFYSIEKLFKKPKWYWYILLILSLTFSNFAGYIQLALYIYLFAGFYALTKAFFSKRKDIKTLLYILLSFVLSTLLSAIQLIPLSELVFLSNRSNYPYNVLLERLLPPSSLITILVPDFFGNPATMNYFMQGGSILERANNIGVWPFVFSILALFSRKTFTRNFFAFSAFVIYLSMISSPITAYIHSIGIPLLSTGIPTRALSLFSFSLSVLGAIGFNAVLSQEIKKKTIIKVIGVFSFVFIFLWLSTFVFSDTHMSISRRNLVIPSIVFILGIFFFLLRLGRNRFGILFVLLAFLELFYSFQKFNSFVPAGYIYPKSEVTQKLRSIQGINRFWGYGSANIDASFQIIEKNYTTAGYDPLFSKRYGEFIAASKDGKFPTEIPRTVADIIGGYGVNDLKNNPYRKRALDLTGTTFVLNKKEDKGIDSAFSEQEFKLIWENNGWQIYRNMHAVLRPALFGEYEVILNPKKIIQKLYSNEFDPTKTLILERQIPSGYNLTKNIKGEVKLSSYTPNKIVFNVKSDSDAFVYLSDNYFPGWVATVDGRVTPIYRANYTFRAVLVKKGAHEVILKYKPASFRNGALISGGALIGLIIIAFFSYKYKKI